MEPLEPQPGKAGYSYDPEGDKLSKSLYTSMIQSSKEIEFLNRNHQQLDDKKRKTYEATPSIQIKV